MPVQTIAVAPDNGSRRATTRCYGRCGRRLELPAQATYEHKILLCRECWTALRSTLLHLVRVLKEIR